MSEPLFKKILTQILWIFKNTFFYRTPPEAASGKFTDREISKSQVKDPQKAKWKTENSDRKNNSNS